jgi:hypothetical protein
LDEALRKAGVPADARVSRSGGAPLRQAGRPRSGVVVNGVGEDWLGMTGCME